MLLSFEAPLAGFSGGAGGCILVAAFSGVPAAVAAPDPGIERRKPSSSDDLSEEAAKKLQPLSKEEEAAAAALPSSVAACASAASATPFRTMGLTAERKLFRASPMCGRRAGFWAHISATRLASSGGSCSKQGSLSFPLSFFLLLLLLLLLLSLLQLLLPGAGGV
jgi:hypothetical protein